MLERRTPPASGVIGEDADVEARADSKPVANGHATNSTNKVDIGLTVAEILGETTIADAARKYQALGWYLVPIPLGRKGPIVEGWNVREGCKAPHDALPHELGNIGLAHAFSGTGALDVDDAVAARAALKLEGIDLDAERNAPGACVWTSGREGRFKLLFRMPEGDIGRWLSVTLPGVQFRCAALAKDGYKTLQDVLPPSIHPDTGQAYYWESGEFSTPPMLPDPLARLWLDRVPTNRASFRLLEIPDDKNPFLKTMRDLHLIRWARGGAHIVTCPWYTSHSDPNEDTAAVFADGGFSCFHHHCAGRTPADFRAWLKSEHDVDVVKVDRDLNAAQFTAVSELPDVDEATAAFGRLVRHSNMTLAASKPLKKTLAKQFECAVSDIEDGMRDRAVGKGALPRDNLTHGEIALALLDQLAAQHPPELVNCEAALWYADGAVWKKYDVARIESMVADRFKAQRLCRKQGDYTGITKHILKRNEQPTFFSDAPRGLMTPNGFHLMDGTVSTPSTELRQRFSIDFDPAPGPMPLFKALLQAVTPDCRASLQEFTGAMLVGAAVAYNRVMLLIGESGAGKSKYLRLMELIVGPGFFSSVSPVDFVRGEFIVGMSGMRLNAVSELPDDKVVSSDKFKEIISGDTITARPLYANPCKVTLEAGHVFSANVAPATEEDNAAFWNRWIMVEWTVSHDRKKDIQNLGDLIYETERAAVVAWALEGAKRLKEQNHYTLGSRHGALIDLWNRERNSVFAWIEARTDRADGLKLPKKAALDDYETWCIAKRRKRVSGIVFEEQMNNYLLVDHTPTPHNIKTWSGIGLSFGAVDAKS